MRLRNPTVRSRMSAKSGMIGSARNNRLDNRYVLMAKKSHASGDRKFGQSPRSLGYGINHHASQGRPRWISGNMAPIDSANAVITSAQRVTGRRHVAFTIRSMAE